MNSRRFHLRMSSLHRSVATLTGSTLPSGPVRAERINSAPSLSVGFTYGYSRVSPPGNRIGGIWVAEARAGNKVIWDLSDQHREASENNGASVGGEVTHPGGGHAADQGGK